MDKQLRYTELVAKRRECRLCESHDLTNPSACQNGAYDVSGHIGPWTQWQGNLNADLMVIAQDWGGVEYFIEHKGLEEDTNTTNRRTCDLLSSIGISIQLPRQSRNSSLFFTNSVLCLRPGRLTGPIKSRWFTNCSTNFLRPQVELVNPKVVVTLGHMAYRALLKAYSLRPKPRMREAVQEIVRLPGGNLLVPVFHPGNNGTRSRSFENQKADWQRVRLAMDGKAELTGSA
jgi:uracil-DNA glycosylase family 4